MAEGGGGERASGSTPTVFISYASQDAAVAKSIVENLEHHGLRCWLAPRDVKPGTLYADAIVGAINEARALVLVLSANAVTSSHVSREVERAASKRRPMIAFRIDAAPLSRALEYFLGESQWIDVRALGMPAALAKLAETLGQVLGQTVAADPVATAKPLKRTGERAKLFVGASVVISVGVAVALGVHFWSQSHNAAQSAAAVAITEKSVAVLPFVDMSEKKDQEYFSDGLSEELIDMLTKVPELRVPARTSSFYFKGKQATIADIAKALAVAHVLEGSVRKSGNTLRITAQLIRVDNGYHVWSETYDRKFDDIFKIQDDIARSVVAALRVSLLEAHLSRTTPSANSEAYTLYLQAQSIMSRGTHADSQKAIEYLHQSLEFDPSFAPAWAVLAAVLASDFGWGISPIDEVSAKAHAAASRAIKLDPTLPLGHVAMGRTLYLVDWNWDAAEPELKQALALEPRSADAYRFLAYIAITRARFDEAIGLLKRAIALDPLHPWNYVVTGFATYRLGRLADAEAAYQKALDLAPTGGKIHCLLGSVLLVRGHPSEALDEMKRETDEGYRRVGLALALDALGQTNKANAELEIAEQQFGRQKGYWIALVYASRRDAEQAFRWLDSALHEHDSDLLWMRGDPLLGALATDPRYKALLRKMNLPE